MNRTLQRILTFSIAMALASLSSVSWAGETLSPNIASQIGLEQAWQRQLQVPAGAQSIVDQQIFVHQTKPYEYVEVVATLQRESKKENKEGDSKADPAETYTKVMMRISTDQVDERGVTISKAEAERMAGNEIRRLTHRGIKAEINTRTVPRINLYTLSDDGTLDCRNAETGVPIWMVRVGNREIGYSKMGIGDDFLTVINGGNLTKLDASDGTELESVRTTTMPLFGAIHAGGYSIMPTIRNGIEGYPLHDATDVPFSEIVEGLALSPPRKSPDSTKIAWGTNRGFVYVMESQGNPSILFRLNTDGIVSGRIAAGKGDRFYFGSESGQVYGLRATRVGQVLWSRPYGEPFYDASMLIDNQLLLRSTYGNLYSLNTADGMMTWTYTVPNVDQLLAAFDGRLFTRSLAGGFMVIDLKSGKILLKTSEVQPLQLLPNTVTDRLYLVGETGAVQCLRPTGSVIPKLNAATDVAAPASETTESNKKEPAGPTAAFAGQSKAKDPFGADAAPAAGGNDPFGGAAADPFGGGGDAMADPFGGGNAGGNDPFADPFGN